MDKNPAFAAFVRSLAVELSILTGAVIQAEITDYWQDYLNFPTGERISISQDRTPAVFRIYAAPPLGTTVNVYDAPKIGANSRRSAEAIAGDIARRMLPDARDWWGKCREVQATHEEHVRATAATIATLAPHMESRTEHDQETAHVYSYSSDTRAEVYGQEIHDFRISHLTVDQALQIFDILKK